MTQLESTATVEKKTGDSTYDEIPYPSHPFRQTHPDRLEAIGRLFGMNPKPPHQSRILEIGCAGGGNLIPMADQMPDAELWGIDLSQRQIKDGNAIIDAAGIKNLKLDQLDILKLDAHIGEFDYIICHGVYSWVPDDVQKRILEIYQSCLTPQGIGYISFNTYPGWHFRGLIRDMMCFHVRNLEDPNKRIEQSRALLQFLSQNVDNESSAYGMLLKNELNLLNKQSDSYLFHEHLEAFNHPVYFHEFAELAWSHQLQYLGDANFSTMWSGNFKPEVAKTLERVAPDMLQREQYSDFLRNRTFRQSLLCHANVKINRNLTAEQFEEARVCGAFRQGENETEINLSPDVSVKFIENISGRTMETNDALLKAAIVHISNAFPGSISVDELFKFSQNSLITDTIEDVRRVEARRNDLVNHIIKLFVSGLVEIKYSEDRFKKVIEQFPKVSSLTAYNAKNGNPVTNGRHELVALDDLTRRICPMLNGETDAQTVFQNINEMIDSGELVINTGTKGEDVTKDKKREEFLAKAISMAMNNLSNHALFV